MGQGVSADAAATDLKELLRLGRSGVSSGTSGGGTESLGTFDGHHIKAWKFESQGRGISDSPVDLCDRAGNFNADLQRTSSYLIVHLRPSKVCGATVEQAASPSDELEVLLDSVGSLCTPRGLAVEVSSHDEGAGRGDAPAAAAMRYAVFVWHGLGVEPLVKAYAMGKAFELDRLLRHGLLHQPAFLEGLKRAVPVRGVSRPSRAGQRQQAPKDNALGGNRLINSMFDCAQKGTQSAISGASSALRPNGAQHRFPHLGLSVCRAAGLASPRRQPVPLLSQAGFPQQRAAPTAPTGAGGVGSAPMPQLAPTGAGASAGSSPGVMRAGKIAIPRLALGGLTSLQGAAPEKAAAAAAMGAEAAPAGDCKRFRGADASAARGPASAVSTAASTSCAAAVPQTARLGIAPLQLQQLQQQPPSGDAPATARGVPALGKIGQLGGGGGVPSLNLGAMRPGPATTVAQPMLNLEEIQMSEEELANSYDPNNEENNYHLPHHLYKQLKLTHFRKECSEVIQGMLFISSFQVAGDIERLRQDGITHIVNTAGDICENHFPDHFTYLTYYLKDTNSEDISVLFYKTLAWIERAIDGGGRVLVHCREGVSRSATMVIAYLMWKFDLSFDAAHERIRRVRPICNPNTSFTCQLLRLGKRLGGAAKAAESPSSSAPVLLRVGPYHPREPFMIAQPVDLSSTGVVLDPRFGWLLQQGLALMLWLGSQIPDVHRQAVQDAAAQHAGWLETFERTKCTLQLVEEGREPPELWQALRRLAPEGQEPAVATRAALDASFGWYFGSTAAEDRAARDILDQYNTGPSGGSGQDALYSPSAQGRGAGGAVDLQHAAFERRRGAGFDRGFEPAAAAQGAGAGASIGVVDSNVDAGSPERCPAVRRR